MKPLSGLYSPIPFLLRYPIYHQKYYADEAYTLQLRPFSIMEDIATVYTWINKPRLLSSGHVKPYQRHMLKYYKTILDSSDSQTFMVLEGGKPVCQFDIFPASTDPLHSGMSQNIHDITLKYLADFRIPQKLFRNSLLLCLEYIFSFSEDPQVFMSLLPQGILNGTEFTSAGCKFIDGVPHEQEIVKVFSCKKSGLANI